MKKHSLLLLCGLLFFCSAPARAACPDTCNYTLHDSISVTSAISLVESAALKFGNFLVGNPGGGDATIVIDNSGIRQSHNGASTTITLLNGGSGGDDAGSARDGIYTITGAGDGTKVYIAFVDLAGVAITPGNRVVLVGPIGSGNFTVDSFTFNKGGTDGGGDYINASNPGGAATVHVGATLHTQAGAATYAAGTYTGTFEIMASY